LVDFDVLEDDFCGDDLEGLRVDAVLLADGASLDRGTAELRLHQNIYVVSYI
jgi:hypothetical protein